jgi:hypothetical protein
VRFKKNIYFLTPLFLFFVLGCNSSLKQGGFGVQSKNKDIIIKYDDWDTKRSIAEDKSNIALIENNIIEVFIDSSSDSSRKVKFEKNIEFNQYDKIKIDLDLKCLDIGLDDNGTGQYSFFSLEYDDNNYDVGFRIIIIGDRYKVDNYVKDELHNQLKIFRTDSSWHNWSFTVNVKDKTVSMERDGVYYAKHRIGKSKNANSISVIISGNESDPTRLQFKEISITKIDDKHIFPSKPFASIQDVNPKSETGDWPMFRKDRRNSGHSNLRGVDFRRNEIAWSYSLGGFSGSYHPADINNDGTDEILLTYPGSLSAFDFNGKLIWKKPIVNCEIYGLYDLDGDGKEELVIAGGTPKSIKVLDPNNGEILYNCEYDPTYDVVFVRIANLDPSTPGKNIIVTTRHEIGYCLSFDSGIENGKVKFTFDWMLTNFIPAVAVADMDLDGVNEIVIGTYSNFFVFDGINGATKSHLVAETGRNYGLMVIQDINGSGYPDIVMLASNLREHITVIENHEGKYLELLWDRLFEQNYPNDYKELKVYENSIFDYDGDGKTEILYGLFDELDGNKWRTYIVDALSGEEKYRIDDSMPLGLLIQENTKKRFLLLADNEPRKISSYIDLRVVTFESGSIKSLGKVSSARPLYNDSSRDFELNAFSTSSVPRTFRKLDGLIDSFIISHGENGSEISAVRVSDDKIKIEKLLNIPLEKLPKGSVLNINTVKGQKDPIVSYSGQDTKMYFISNEKKYLCSVQAGGYLGLPLVASKNNVNHRNIIVHDSGNKLKVLKEIEGEIKLEWEFQTAVKPSGFGAYQGRQMPIIGDFFNDGENSIAALSKSNEIVLLNFDGEIINKYEFPGNPIFISYGSFLGEENSQLFVSYGDGTVSSKSTILNSSGTKKWTLSIGNGSPAILDMDSDGYDDIVTRDLFERRSVDGQSGTDIYPITSWAGYHIPTVIEDEAGGSPKILWSGGNYSLVLEYLDGKQKWWKPFMANRSPAGIADVNGDNKLEVGSYTVGQVYNWPDFYAVNGPNNEFVCYDLKSGDLLWKHFIGSPISGVITADIDNDGLPEFLFGTSDGRLIALNGNSQIDNRVVFERQFPASLGTPIIADLDGEGNIQILVGCADGNLYSLKPN